MIRTITRELLKWKDGYGRKPLLLTGVRQCGKTWLLQEFCKQNFEQVAYLNFEKQTQAAEIFDYDLDPERIIRELGSLFFGFTIVPGKTALILAIEGNQFDLVKLLLDGGASQGWRAPNGEAPIHVAARSASGDIARLLISHGANVEEENADGDDPLDIAKNYGNTSAESVIDDAHSWSVWKWIKYISIAVLIIAAFVSCCIYKWLIAVYVVLIVLFVKFCAG